MVTMWVAGHSHSKDEKAKLSPQHEPPNGKVITATEGHQDSSEDEEDDAIEAEKKAMIS